MSLEPGIGGTHGLRQICEDLQLKCTAAVLNHLCYLAIGHLHVVQTKSLIGTRNWWHSSWEPGIGVTSKHGLSNQFNSIGTAKSAPWSWPEGLNGQDGPRIWRFEMRKSGCGYLNLMWLLKLDAPELQHPGLHWRVQWFSTICATWPLVIYI